MKSQQPLHGNNKSGYGPGQRKNDRMAAKSGSEQAQADSSPRDVSASGTHAQVMRLHQTIGNRAVAQLMRSRKQPSAPITKMPAGQPVVQRIQTHTGQQVEWDWNNLVEDDMLRLISKLGEGSWVLEPGENEAYQEALAAFDMMGHNEDHPEITEPEINFRGEETKTFGELWGQHYDESESDDEEFNGDMMHPYALELKNNNHKHFQDKVAERDGKKLPQRQVQGGIFENLVSLYNQDLDIREVDANAYSMNMPGIDHIRDTNELPFLQDKLHLLGNAEENARAYRQHYKELPKMAEKFIAGMSRDGERGNNIRQMISDIIGNIEWENKAIMEQIHTLVNEHRDEVDAAIDDPDPNRAVPTIENLQDTTNLVAENIGFLVPADTWEVLQEQFGKSDMTEDELRRYIRIDLESSDLSAVLREMDDVANPMNYRAPKADNLDYDPEEDEKVNKKSKKIRKSKTASEKEKDRKDKRLNSVSKNKKGDNARKKDKKNKKDFVESDHSDDENGLDLE